MSIKIYNGFVIQTGSITEVRRVVDTFRVVMLKRQEEMYRNFLRDFSVKGMFEDEGLTKADRVKKACSLWDHWCAEVRTKRLRNPLVDTDFSLLFIPHNGWFYGIGYTEQSKWFDEWLKQPMVKDYHYQNQTDPPEDIPEAEFAARGRMWNILLDKYPCPSMAGFTIDVTNPNGPNVYSNDTFEYIQTLSQQEND